MKNIEFIKKSKPNQPHFVDLEGQQFGRWKVIFYLGSRNTNGKKIGSHWLCECSCELNTKSAVRTHDLTLGKSKSCGCLREEMMTTHGLHESSEYKSYYCAKTRCNNSNIPEYKDYGGRGIKMYFRMGRKIKYEYAHINKTIK